MKAGRPAHEPTATKRQLVAILAGGGWTQAQLAVLLDIDIDTLTKHYRHELTVVAAEKRAEVMQAIYRSAKKGSVPAAKLYTQAGAPVPTENSLEIVTMQPGVKAQRNEQAKSAPQGSEWQPLLPSNLQ